MNETSSEVTDIMSFAEVQLAAHDVACFCRVLHC